MSSGARVATITGGGGERLQRAVDAIDALMLVR
jgi:hypothetical protein